MAGSRRRKSPLTGRLQRDFDATTAKQADRAINCDKNPGCEKDPSNDRRGWTTSTTLAHPQVWPQREPHKEHAKGDLKRVAYYQHELVSRGRRASLGCGPFLLPALRGVVGFRSRLSAS